MLRQMDFKEEYEDFDCCPEFKRQIVNLDVLNSAALGVPNFGGILVKVVRYAEVDKQTTHSLRPRLSAAQEDKKLSPHLYLFAV